MRVLACLALAACSSFGSSNDGDARPSSDADSGATTTKEDGSTTTPEKDAGLAPSGMESFCAAHRADADVHFCSDFEKNSVFDDWPLRNQLAGTWLRAQSPSAAWASTVARVQGTNVPDGTVDKIGAALRGLPPAAKGVELVLYLWVGGKSSRAEIATLTNADGSVDLATLYLSDDVLKLRNAEPEDTPGLTIARGQWTVVSLLIDAQGAQVHAGSATDVRKPSPTLTAFSRFIANLWVGIYFKQELGDLDYAIDEVRILAK
jgi:hypothetical protein